MTWSDAKKILGYWFDHKLKNVRFSGGEPTIWPHIVEAVKYCNMHSHMERIAISTNGSASLDLYQELIDAGVTDFSISFDACCAEDCSKMSGGKDAWKTLTETIKFLSDKVYTTAGVVLTEDNEDRVVQIVDTARSLGVSDIRVIPAAQHGKALESLPDIIDMPILDYRRNKAKQGESVRGLRCGDCRKCSLVLDDMAVIGNKHYPCIIYAREGGAPIGTVGPLMRHQRKLWMEQHDSLQDPICANNCLDVCRDYNNKVQEIKSKDEHILP
jgi:MoaA/NifB/PqqE/SkfB family radical SAM enzyme